MRKGLLFDLDGTLWDSTGVIRPVWNEVLAAHGRAALSEADFAGLMGLTKAAIAARVFPDSILVCSGGATGDNNPERHTEAGLMKQYLAGTCGIPQ